MNYIEINGYNDKLKVSRIAMGSAMSMMRLSSDEIARLFDIYLDAGGNCLDTARSYGEGRCEAMVADYLKQSGKRNQVLLVTKGCHPRNEQMDVSRLSKADMTQDINDSLKTFGVSEFDIYWIHKDDERIPVEEIVDSMNEVIIKPGKARFVGCSNWHTARIEAANAYAASSGQQGFLGSQIQWSLAETKEEYFKEHGAVVMDEVSYQWYLSKNMPVFAFSSQAQGFFPRVKAEGVENLPEMLRNFYVTPENLARYERALAIAERHNVSLSAPALCYLTCNKLPAVAIIGALTPDMLRQSLESTKLSMTADEADALYYGE